MVTNWRYLARHSSGDAQTVWSEIFLTLVTGMVALHWVGVGIGIRSLIFATGASLAFYVPGALLVWLNPSFFRAVSWVERFAMSIILSITFITIAAFTLDLTSFGIYDVTLSAAITVLLFIVVLVRLWRGNPWPGDINRHFSLELVLVTILVLAWLIILPAIADLAKVIDKTLTSRPTAAYSALTLTCRQSDNQQEDTIEFLIIDRQDINTKYNLTVNRDDEQITATDLIGRANTNQALRYIVNVQRGWHQVSAALHAQHDSEVETDTLLTKISPEMCLNH
jgi:hypothetical protein